MTPMKQKQEVRRFLQEPHGVTSQKTPFSIVTAVKPPNLTRGTKSRMLLYELNNKKYFFNLKLLLVLEFEYESVL
jgi:hypothetical protein